MAQKMEDLRPDDLFGMGTRSDGSLIFREGIIFGDHRAASRKREMVPKQVVAIALTEACCRMGRGKVFFVPSPIDTCLKSRFDGKEKWTGFSMAGGLPTLVYWPVEWTEQERVDWLAMHPKDRLHLVNARAGALPRSQCVMPIDLTFTATERGTIYMSPYQDEDHGSKATLLLLPKAYLGWCTQMQAHVWASEKNQWGFKKATDYRLVARDSLRTAGFDMADTMCIVRRLEEMYYEGESRSLLYFDDLVDVVVKLHRRVAGQ